MAFTSGLALFAKQSTNTPISDPLHVIPWGSWAGDNCSSTRALLSRWGLIPCFLPREMVFLQKQGRTWSLHLPSHSALQWPAHNTDPGNAESRIQSVRNSGQNAAGSWNWAEGTLKLTRFQQGHLLTLIPSFPKPTRSKSLTPMQIELGFHLGSQ